jgi:ABC-type Na+ efflux pump permease subunit
MINLSHLKVLLKKDFLTLWRSKFFILGFFLIPVLLMYSFIYIMNQFNKGVKEGSLIYNNFKYTTTK